MVNDGLNLTVLVKIDGEDGAAAGGETAPQCKKGGLSTAL
ncbi:hypothetical protein SAMN05880561_103218 [Rhizobium sp. RU33A]|nr:hypothetical protein SAMN05880561_103218 [Rhizobium sp. RU33A]